MACMDYCVWSRLSEALLQKQPQEHPEDAPSLGSGVLRVYPSPQVCSAVTFYICILARMSLLNWFAAEITHKGILNVKRSLCRQRRCHLKYDLLDFKWSLLNALSPFIAEWTHLLLSGPHVPLVRADLKAPVQCSPCKKKKN